MKTGIVFEICNGKATILKPNGEFTTVPASRKWKKGDVVHFPQTTFNAKKLCAAAASFFFLITAGLWGGSLYFTPVATVSMDVNPAIELKLNRYDKVISVRAMDEDASSIAEQAGMVYKDYGQAVASLFEDNSGLAPYLSDNPTVVFTVYADDAGREAVLTEGLERAAGNHVTISGAPVSVECHQVDSKTQEHARQYGVTPGKYLYLQQLMEADPSLEIEDYTHHTIRQIKEQIEACGHSYSEDSCSGHHDSRHCD